MFAQVSVLLINTEAREALLKGTAQYSDLFVLTS